MTLRVRTAVEYSETDYDALLGKIYEAALRPQTWGDVLLGIGRPINAHAGQLIALSDDVSDFYENVLVGIDLEKGLPEFTELIEAGLHVRANAVQRTAEMTTVTDYEHVTAREMKRHPFYQDHVYPLGIPYYGATVIKKSAGTLIASAVFRSQRQGHLSPADIRYLNRLAPHIRRSIELSLQLPSAGIAHGAMTVLEGMRCGGIIVDGQLSVAAMNDHAAGMLAEHDGISDSGNQLCLADPLADLRLREQVRRCMDRSELRSPERSGCIRAGRSSGRSPYTLVVMPLRHLREAMFRTRHTLVLVLDPERDFRFPRGFLRSAFDLTPAESGVARLLVGGKSVGEIAKARGCTVETVRSQLKKVFEKTGCHHQSELVARLLKDCSVPLR